MKRITTSSDLGTKFDSFKAKMPKISTGMALGFLLVFVYWILLVTAFSLQAKWFITNDVPSSFQASSFEIGVARFAIVCSGLYIFGATFYSLLNAFQIWSHKDETCLTEVLCFRPFQTAYKNNRRQFFMLAFAYGTIGFLILFFIIYGFAKMGSWIYRSDFGFHTGETSANIAVGRLGIGLFWVGIFLHLGLVLFTSPKMVNFTKDQRIADFVQKWVSSKPGQGDFKPKVSGFASSVQYAQEAK